MRIALRPTTSTIFSNLTNEEIQERERELHLKLARLLPDLPLVQTIAVSRPDGLMLLTANVYPVPPNTWIPDREWISDLKIRRSPHPCEQSQRRAPRCEPPSA
jgi:hypothetical protein